ncbi:hypothetical protein TL16_g07486 [Triparma laevis f. inornata]|uniref:Uncharacterized protein n=1 Tax=Triparma laevis f. inornata TaxID=1714386 RepID=A0A9W7AW40_9STRA|nr:hypothetical protein TL16_g07486 [Triparma laevis f. inornata]
MLQASSRILKTQGLGGFYKGLGTYVTADGIAGSIKFATYETLKKVLKNNLSDDPKKAEQQERWGMFIAAGAAFIASSVVLVPGELIKQRMQMGQISSDSSAGMGGVCFRDVPYTMLELGLYDNFKVRFNESKTKMLTTNNSNKDPSISSQSLYLKYKTEKSPSSNPSTIELTQFDEILCAAVTGGLTGYFTNPADVVKTKLMTDTSLYTGFFDAGRKQISSQGMSSLFNGGVARVAWLMPFTAIYLPVYEEIKRNLVRIRVKGNTLRVRGGAANGARGICYV